MSSSEPGTLPDRIRAKLEWIEAWRLLNVSFEAPTPERQEALERAWRAIRILLPAMRTLTNPNASEEAVRAATAIADEAWLMFDEGPPEQSARNLLIERIEAAALFIEHPELDADGDGVERALRSFGEFFPAVAAKVDRATFERAAQARARGRFNWRLVLAVLQSAGLTAVSVGTLRVDYSQWKGRSFLRSLRTRRKRNRT